MSTRPLYRYSMEILETEEYGLIGQPLWYKGASDGYTWMYEACRLLMDSYMGDYQ